MKDPTTTPLRALLRMSAIAAAAPDLFGPSHGTADSRTHAPEGLGHSLVHPASMASFARKMTNGPVDVLGAGSGKIDELVGNVKGDTAHMQAEGASLVEIEEAVGAVDTDFKKS